MKISVSSLAFTGAYFCDMAELPKDIGIEIFCEWGSFEYWKKAIPFVMKDRTGSFSMHAPFEYFDFSNPSENEEDLFKYLSSHFALYHNFNSDSYVIHTNDIFPNDISSEEIAVRRSIVEERLVRLNNLAFANGIVMLIENLGWGVAGKTLFDEKSFLDLFRRHPEFNCIIDVGHAIVEHFDVEKLQRELGTRIKAYHIHNNDGLHDSHKHLTDGVYDYSKFVRDALRYTPDATLVIECAQCDALDDTKKDIDFLKLLLS